MNKSFEGASGRAGEWVNGVDHAWLRMDSATNPMIINALIITDQLDEASLSQLLKQRLLSFDRFKQRPVEHMGVHYWEDDPLFDLKEHIEEVRLTTDTKASLQAYVGQHVSRPLDPRKPLWQIKLIQGYDAGSAVFLRVHHSYADGVSLIKVFDHLTDTHPEEASSTPASPPFRKANGGANAYPLPFYQKMVDLAWHTAEKTMQFSAKASEEGLHILRDPTVLSEYAKDTVKAIGELSRLSLMPGDSLGKLKPPLTSQKCCAWSDPVPLDEIKRIALVLGGKVNDVLLAIMSGALREYLIGRGEAIDGKVIHVAVPVNLRQGEQEQSKALGNQFGTIFVPLPVGLDSPLDRLFQLRKDTALLKSSPQPVMSFGMLYAAGLLPRSIQQNVLNLYSNKVSAVLSNVPGTRERRYLAGRAVRQQMFWVPQTGDVGLGLSMVSYGGEVQFGVVSDKNICDQPEQIMDSCLHALAVYTELVNKISA